MAYPDDSPEAIEMSAPFRPVSIAPLNDSYPLKIWLIVLLRGLAAKY